MKKLLLFAATVMVSLSMMAEGAQSLQVAFNGFDNTNWKVSSGGSILSIENGVMNVQMAIQTNEKYRADLQYQISGTYTFDKSKDIVWAVKLTSPLPGSTNSRKFEINYKKDGENTWINGINNPSGQIDCTDGGRIYYFNLGADGLNKLGDVPAGAQVLNNIHFIFADAVCETEEEARYGVDWVATFASVSDLEAAADWNDDITSSSAIFNARTRDGYTDLKEAVEAAAAGDVLVLNENVTYSDSRLEIKKALTIQGATGKETIISDVPAGQILVLANHNEEDYDVTFRNLIIDGQNIERSTQLLDANNHGRFVLENISIINTAYSVVAGDVKSSQREVVLGGNCSFATGIYLNGGKRVDGKNATHTAEHPIRLILHDDYKEDYAIVLNCNDSTLYTAVDAASQTGWELYVSGGKELKGRKVELPTGMEQSDIMNRASKIIRDGRIVIRRGEDLYDISGQIIK